MKEILHGKNKNGHFTYIFKVDQSFNIEISEIIFRAYLLLSFDSHKIFYTSVCPMLLSKINEFWRFPPFCSMGIHMLSVCFFRSGKWFAKIAVPCFQCSKLCLLAWQGLFFLGRVWEDINSYPSYITLNTDFCSSVGTRKHENCTVRVKVQYSVLESHQNTSASEGCK